MYYTYTAVVVYIILSKLFALRDGRSGKDNALISDSAPNKMNCNNNTIVDGHTTHTRLSTSFRKLQNVNKY